VDEAETQRIWAAARWAIFARNIIPLTGQWLILILIAGPLALIWGLYQNKDGDGGPALRKGAAILARWGWLSGCLNYG
jgi:hypothetical protein